MKKLLLLSVLLSACTRTPAPQVLRQDATSVAVSNVAPDAVAPIDARADVAPASEHSILSSTCDDMNELTAGLETARDAGVGWFACRTDAGVQMRLALNVERGVRPLWLATMLQRHYSAMSPARRREEVALTEREMRSGTVSQFASAELAMRNAERTIGRIAAVRGTVIDAREDGVTMLTVGVGPLEVLPLQVVYPSAAEEWVVAGARVRLVGVWGQRDGNPVLFAALIERR